MGYIEKHSYRGPLINNILLKISCIILIKFIKEHNYNNIMIVNVIIKR